MRVRVAVCVLLGAVSAQARSFEVSRAAYHNPRFFGMGGAFVAVSDDRNLFFTNPAGLQNAPGRSFTFGLLPVSLNTNTLDIIDFYRDNDDRFQNLNDLSGTEQAQFYDDVLDAIGGKRAETSAHFPLAILWPASEDSRMPSFGLGFFARGGTAFLAQNGAAGIPVTTLDIEVEYTGVLSAAYSWDELLPGRLSVGGSFKVDYRQLSLNTKSILALSEDEDLDLLSATGFGLDVGAQYQLTPRVTVGAALYDLIHSDFEFSGGDRVDPLAILADGDVGELEPSLAVGGAFRPGVALGPISDVLLALDVTEPFDGDRSFWKGVHIGAEGHLGWLAPRFGFYQGYPGAGLGLGPIQYAYFSTEVGSFPGARSNYAHVLSLEFRFGR